MDFSQALQKVKDGAKIARSGWNGKNMCVFLVGGGTMSHPALWMSEEVSARPYLAMFTAQGDVVPWVASQTDILADDWEFGELMPSGTPESPLAP